MSIDREKLVDLIAGKVMEELRLAGRQSPAESDPGPPVHADTVPVPTANVGPDAAPDPETRERMRLFSVSGARSPE